MAQHAVLAREATSRPRALAALKKSDLEGLRRELAAGLSPDSRDLRQRTLLHAALDRLRARRRKQRTPLICNSMHEACIGKHIGEIQAACIVALLSAGADVRARDGENCTPLHYCMDIGGASTAKLLLEAGADVNAVNDHGENSLHFASHTRATDCVEVLLAAGSRVDVCDRRLNIDALMVATLSNARQLPASRKMTWLLLRAGARNPKYPANWAPMTRYGKLECEFRPYLTKIDRAGGFKKYEQQRVKALVAIFRPFSCSPIARGCTKTTV